MSTPLKKATDGTVRTSDGIDRTAAALRRDFQRSGQPMTHGEARQRVVDSLNRSDRKRE